MSDTIAHWLRRRPVLTRLVLILAFALLLAVLPGLVNSYWERLLVFVFVNIALASAWNLVGGVAGYPSFGHGVFFGLGAYTAAIVMVRWEMGLLAALLAGGLVAGLFALLFIPILRQRGFYFALSTLAAMLAVQTALREWRFTRGLAEWDLGWTLPDVGSLHFYYYLMLGLLAGTLVAVVITIHSKVGHALHAIHKDEIVAASVGIPCTRYKAIAFVISAAIPGVIGAAYAPFLTYISVENVFDLAITLNMILIAIFGGIGTVVGPVVGGIALTVIDQVAWANFLDYHRLIFGLLIVLVITFRPGGVVSWFRRRPRRSPQAAQPVAAAREREALP